MTLGVVSLMVAENVATRVSNTAIPREQNRHPA